MPGRSWLDEAMDAWTLDDCLTQQRYTASQQQRQRTSGCMCISLDCSHRRANTAAHASTVIRRGQRSITYPICQISYSFGPPPIE